MAASKCQQFGVVEQMTRESTHMDVDKVVGFLMDAKLADARPLINVCDRFDRVTELTKFLYENNLLRCGLLPPHLDTFRPFATAQHRTHRNCFQSSRILSAGKADTSCMYKPERDPELNYSVHRTACFGERTALELLKLPPLQMCVHASPRAPSSV